MSNDLHVFCNETVEWVIAYDAEDAVKVWEETMGYKYDPDQDGGEFLMEPDINQITVFYEDGVWEDELPKEAFSVKPGAYRATCKQWAEAYGRSWLCTDMN